jgi:Cation transporting ATPase, C-terminus
MAVLRQVEPEGEAGPVAVALEAALDRRVLQSTARAGQLVVRRARPARIERGSIRSAGLWSNRLLLWGILFELVFAAALAYASPLQAAFGTAAPPTLAVALLFPFPFVVWAVDDVWRRRVRP